MPEQISLTVEESIKYLTKKIEKLYHEDKVATDEESFSFNYVFDCSSGNDNLPKMICKIIRYYEPYLLLLKLPYNYRFEDEEDDGDTLTFYKNSPNCDLKDLLRRVNELPTKYYYSKVFDCFLRNDQKDLEKEEIAKRVVGNNDDKCCVCYEYTMTKTKCGHFLCRECAHKSLKFCECDDCLDCGDNSLKLECPVCREFLAHHFS